LKDAFHNLVRVAVLTGICLAPAGADDEKKTPASGAVTQKSKASGKKPEAGKRTDARKNEAARPGSKPASARPASGKSASAKAVGEKSPENKGAAPRNSRPVNRPAVNRLPAADVESAMKFAREHHPELARLLEKLRGKSDVEFHRGIREVHVAVVRLERYREKQPARFEAGLRDWKRDSEIRLLSAKWIVSGDEKLEKRIQQLLRARMEARIENMKTERTRLAARLEQLEQQINMDTAEMEAALTAEWERLSRRATATGRAKSGERKTPTRKTDKQKKTE